MSTSAPIIGVMYFEAGGKGWSESYGLDGSTLLAAQTTFKDFIPFRVGILGANVKATYSRVSFKDTPNFSLPTQSQPLQALFVSSTAAGNQTNQAVDGLRFRFSTDDGVNSTRVFRGAADEVINQERMDFTFDPAAVLALGAPPPAIVVTDTWNAAYHKFCKALMHFTRHLQKIKTGANAGQYNLLQYTQVMARGPGSRRTGVPFGTSPGRQSVGA